MMNIFSKKHLASFILLLSVFGIALAHDADVSSSTQGVDGKGVIYQVVERLLERGASVDRETLQIVFSECEKDADLILLLLDYSDNINDFVYYGSMTPLQMLCRNYYNFMRLDSDMSVLDKMIEKGADLDAVAKKGDPTALLCLLEGGQPNSTVVLMAKKLLDAGANPHATSAVTEYKYNYLVNQYKAPSHRQMNAIDIICYYAAIHGVNEHTVELLKLFSDYGVVCRDTEKGIDGNDWSLLDEAMCHVRSLTDWEAAEFFSVPNATFVSQLKAAGVTSQQDYTNDIQAVRKKFEKALQDLNELEAILR